MNDHSNNRMNSESSASLDLHTNGLSRLVINSIKDGVFLESPQGKIIDVNDAVCSMLGYPREELCSMDVAALLPPDVAASLAERIKEETLRPGVYIETVNVRKDGTHLPVEVSNTLVDVNGREMVIAIIRDISQRIKAEEDLKESRDYLGKIINSVADPIFVKDRRHRWMFLNEAFCRFMGYPRRELLAKSDYDFFSKEEADVFWDRDEKVFHTGEENLNEEKLTDAQGVTHTIVTKKTLYRNSRGEKFIVGIIRDISERKEMEEMLERAREELEVRVRQRTAELARANAELREEHSLFIGGPTVVFKWKAAFGWPVEYVSPNVTEQFGYRPEDLLDGRRSYESIIHPDDRERVASEIRRYDQSDVRSYQQIYRLAHARGHYRWVNDFTVLFRDDEGRVTHYHGYVLDITEEKEAKEELERHRDHLEELVEKRTAELKGMVDAMARRVVRMSDLEIENEQLKEQIRKVGLVPAGEDGEEKSGDD